jgi:hypothetical protein
VSIERIRVENNQELEQMVAREIGQISNDLTIICSNVSINDKTTLDILCHDSNGQLVIVQLSVGEDDFMLFNGMQSLDYVSRFKTFLKATYNKHRINDLEQPRLILIAPSFSDTLRHTVESMKGIHIDLYEWEYLKLGDHKGLRLQPIFAWAPTEAPKAVPEVPREVPEEKPVEKKRELKPAKKKESTFEPVPEKEEEHAQEPEQPEEFKFEPLPAEKPKEEKEEPPKRKLKLF